MWMWVAHLKQSVCGWKKSGSGAQGEQLLISELMTPANTYVISNCSRDCSEVGFSSWHTHIHTVGLKIAIGARTVSRGTNGSLARLLDLGLWTGLKCHWMISVGLLIEACIYVCHYGSQAPLQAWEHSVTDVSGVLRVQVQSVTWSCSHSPAEPLLSSRSQLMLQPRPTRCEYPK